MITEIKLQEKINSLVTAAGVGGEFPVPVEKLVEHLGFKCYFFEPDDRTMHISGAVDHKEKKVYINKEESLQRQLFTVAHELGHIVLHGAGEDYVDYRDYSNNPKETEANNFAGHLLMPESMFRYLWKEQQGNINALSRFFGVSASAVGVRATILGLD
jgi:Zn-dependent peptidase ImmA (M78 family)